MKWCVVALMLLMSAHAGMRKQQPPPPITAEVNAYDAAGEIQLQPLVEALVGQTIGFKIGDQVEVAVVEHHDATEQHLQIVGKFLLHHDAGFVFEFDRLPDGKTHITAVLSFMDRRKYYTLEADARGMMCFEEHSMDDDAPNTIAVVP